MKVCVQVYDENQVLNVITTEYDTQEDAYAYALSQAQQGYHAKVFDDDYNLINEVYNIFPTDNS